MSENVANKNDLINEVAESTNSSKKDATVAVNATLEAIAKSLADGRNVQLIGFGRFEIRHRATRKGRNPQTGEEIEIPAIDIPAFKPGKALKDLVK